MPKLRNNHTIMKKEEQPQPSTEKRAKDKQQLHIQIERWQDLVDILDDKKKVYRLAIVVVIIGLTLFAGVTFIVLQLKKSFTYSDITTNALGATTLRDEQKEVSYFLFNTATLWANSGIEVKKGDVISVHSSGSAHTAIHHLHDAAKDNYRASEDYFDANGERFFNQISERDKARRKYRLVPDLPNSALIMQVYCGNGRPPLKAQDDDEEAKKNFYYIAQHRENILIHEGGTLYFAINDIVLDSTTIRKMTDDNFAYMLNSNVKLLKDNRELIKKVKAGTAKGTSNNYIAFRKCLAKSIYSFGPYYDQQNHTIDTCTFKTEMDYYLEQNYPTAWFDDNLGSFLIIIERNYRE